MPTFSEREYKCELCGTTFKFGPHIYQGKKLKRYGIMVCSGCWEANWDGWAPDCEKILIDALNRVGQPSPKRNQNGLLPRE